MANVNYHNQFLTCLYDSPQNLNLFDLFYNGIGTWEAPSQAELEQLGVLAADGSQICPTDKFTRADMDAFLLENTGLTLAQTNQVDLDAFDYLPEYDAYYHTHGDTNYRSVTFTSGGAIISSSTGRISITAARPTSASPCWIGGTGSTGSCPTCCWTATCPPPLPIRMRSPG